jgi:DeoR/GlpR family transcriptional regulator of sugar metabolism
MTRQPKRKRQEAILAELRASPALRVSELAAAFSLSTETIRRDLDELSRQGLLSRTYGGATGAPVSLEPWLDDRYHLHSDRRTAIARATATHIADGEALMIDAGATTIFVARRLAAERNDLRVVTTSFGVAAALATNPSIHILCAPGEFDPRDGGVGGPDTLAFLRRFNVGKAIIGASRVDAQGPSDVNSTSVWIKRVMIERAQETILVADHGKFDNTAFETVCPLEEIDFLVTDDKPPVALTRALDRAGVKLHVAS